MHYDAGNHRFSTVGSIAAIWTAGSVLTNDRDSASQVEAKCIPSLPTLSVRCKKVIQLLQQSISVPTCQSRPDAQSNTDNGIIIYPADMCTLIEHRN